MNTFLIEIDAADLERQAKRLGVRRKEADLAFRRAGARAAARVRRQVRPRLKEALGLRRTQAIARRIRWGTRRRGQAVSRVWIGLNRLPATELRRAPGRWKRGGGPPSQQGHVFATTPPSFVGMAGSPGRFTQSVRRRRVMRRIGPWRTRLTVPRVPIDRAARPVIHWASRDAARVFRERFGHELERVLAKNSENGSDPRKGRRR